MTRRDRGRVRVVGVEPLARVAMRGDLVFREDPEVLVPAPVEFFL